jgi:cytochrome c peroxidase
MIKKIFCLTCVMVFVVLVSSGYSQTLSPNEQLGKSIFFDEDLSINKNQSCAACHAPEVGWTGPDSTLNAHGTVYEGSIPGSFGDRKPPSSGYATQSPILFYLVRKCESLFIGGNFWDGRATGEKLGNPAADQAQGPFLNPKEQALPDSACVVYRVCNAAYPVSFEAVWGADACDISWPGDVEAVCGNTAGSVILSAADRAKSNTAYDNIAYSIAAYEASPEVNAFTSKYDYSLKGLAKLTQEERKGFALFQGKGKCAKCHISTGQKPLFTDFTYDNLGIPKNPENPVYLYNPGFIDLGLGGFLASRPDYAQYAAQNTGKVKVPTVRNVDKRPSADFVKAFGHNGYFKSLEAIVHFYNTRDVLPRCETIGSPNPGVNCWPAPEVSANINKTELGNLKLTATEEAAIVAFLKTLSDGYMP